jgi:hypothetical protein
MDTGTTNPRIDINHDGAALQAIRMLDVMIEAEGADAEKAHAEE